MIWAIYLLLSVLVSVIVYAYLHRQDGAHYAPSPTNVLRVVRSISQKCRLPADATEHEVEQAFATALRRYFAPVRTQVALNKSKNPRERVDIDVSAGRVGIEIKLLHQLRKSNERNRLLGQIDNYHARRYTSQNLLIVLAGTPSETLSPDYDEICQLITRKGAMLCLAPVLCLPSRPQSEATTTPECADSPTDVPKSDW